MTTSYGRGSSCHVTLMLAPAARRHRIPSQALQKGRNGQYVYVVRPDQSAEMRSVTVDRTDGRRP